MRNVRGLWDVRNSRRKETSTTKMAITLKNNDTGFVIQTYQKPENEDGTCIMENCIRIGEFWRKGWTETTMFLSLIKTLDGRLITHANILNPKNRQFIDVSNGRIKMIDTGEWFKSNKVIAWGILNYDDALKVKKINGIDYNAINDKEMMGLRCRCNDVFEKLMEFKK